MKISDVLTPERTLCGVDAADKRSTLAALAGLIANGEPLLTRTEVLDCLLTREQQGSTGYGNGIAMPHGRSRRCPRTLGAFIRLSKAVDYEALDGRPVDLLFALLAPESSAREHLELLSRLAEKFSDATVLQRLKTEPSSDKIFSILTSESAP
jgi:PTS system nitrogen regulatory IIA component